MELSDNTEKGGNPLDSKFQSLNFDPAMADRYSNRSGCTNVEQDLLKKQTELNSLLKNQAKEIVFLREESIRGKQDLDNYRHFIEFLVIHTGFQIDQEDAERLKLRLELTSEQTDITSSGKCIEMHKNNGEE